MRLTKLAIIKKYALIFSGWLYLWIVACNIVGEALVRLGSNTPESCYPNLDSPVSSA